MNNPFTIQKILLLPLIVVSFFSFDISKAQAQVPSIFVPVYSAIEHGTSATDALWQDVTENGISMLAYQAGQIALNQLTQNTISWIRGGFNGSPSFAIDTNEIFLGLADMQAAGLAREIRGLATCDFSPTFKDDLANMLELSTRRDAPSKFGVQASCPFPSNINASVFYTAGLNTFEQNGGWEAMEASLNDSGNRFGLNVISGQELAARKSEAKNIQEQKLGWSNGFMDLVDTSDCTFPNGQADFNSIDWSNDPQGKAIMERSFCKTTTPGKIIEGQLSDTLGTDLDRLGFADDLNKIIGALIQQLTQEAVNGIF
ncbi:MAG: hypothetical protein A2937_00370 [Candidatus Yonathbacteria bacterium RIFCSPLOWO2_01_FULL_47_33b]|uniref:Uncharacterized protein n=1 Tax=Candidatus Yonathbacteria bacterium RIFCSPLOWO2_01_FULL_47_33b TaxID=1802727 RepID=A0A1G2SHW1_9BACT|nr:MAG: hypothetical protein A2937_00370 [Candidatus Yonathbacteria bacterium RIFCSPLOWO2_01_FULL_47_33b]